MQPASRTGRKPHSLTRWLEEYLEANRSRRFSSESIWTWKKAIRRYVRQMGDGLPRQHDISRYYAQNKHRSARRNYEDLCNVRKVVRWAYEQGHVQRSARDEDRIDVIFKFILRPTWRGFRKRDDRTLPPLLDREVAHLLEVAAEEFPKLHPLLVLLTETGCELREARELRVEDVDMIGWAVTFKTRARIQVSRERHGHRKLANAEPYWRPNQIKSRTVTMRPRLQDALRPLVEHQPPHARVFPFSIIPAWLELHKRAGLGSFLARRIRARFRREK